MSSTGSIVPAYLLAGGKSSRFGSDKARALVDGRPLLEIAAEAPRALGWPVKVVARAAGAYVDLRFDTIGDLEPDLGPMGGLYTALVDAGDAPWIYVQSCDLVGVQAEWLGALVAARADEADAVCFDCAPMQPLCALYRTALVPRVRAHVEAGRLSPRRLLAKVAAVHVPPPTGWDLLCNVNRAEDLGV